VDHEAKPPSRGRTHRPGGGRYRPGDLHIPLRQLRRLCETPEEYLRALERRSEAFSRMHRAFWAASGKKVDKALAAVDAVGWTVDEGQAQINVVSAYIALTNQREGPPLKTTPAFRARCDEAIQTLATQTASTIAAITNVLKEHAWGPRPFYVPQYR
jgi:hypothetical protein